MTGNGPRLLMIAPAPAIPVEGGVTLDAKFIEGMRLQTSLWPGVFDCVLRSGATDIPFGARTVDPASEPFGLRVIPPDAPLTAADFAGYDVVLCSADDDRNLTLAPAIKQSGAALVSAIEYDLKTRLRIVFLARGRSLPRRCISALRAVMREISRRRFLKQTSGLQANGYPAHRLCKRFDSAPLLYLDNRMTPDLFATDQDMERRALRLRSDAPVRFVYSGRLDPMKGVQDLVPVAKRMADQGAAFSLDIFGAGTLREQVQEQITANALSKCVTLHEPVDFETELVPWLRSHADVFLCCHKQADPSCTYIENMGCGLSVLGYDNDMWVALRQASDAGWASPMGRIRDLADLATCLCSQRDTLVEKSVQALDFAKAHDFLAESRKRMQHLESVAASRV